MRIIKIDGKDHVAKMNTGVLKRSSRTLKMTVPQLLDNIKSFNLDIMTVIIFESIAKYNPGFDMEVLDELSLNEIVDITKTVFEMLTESLPEANPEKKKKK